MGKYYIIFKNSISESLVYRTNVFLIFISQLISTVVLITLWKAIYSDGGQVGSYDLSELIQYFIFIGLITFTIQGLDVSWRVSDDIRLGNITNYILKPVSYYKSILSIALGRSCFNFIIIFLIVAPIIIFSGYFSGLNIDALRIIAVAMSLVISFLLFSTYSYIVGLYTFWVGDGRGFNYVMRLVMHFFSGAIIPLNLLPGYITKTSDWLPFKSMAWIPVSLLTGKIEISFWPFISGIIWIVILMAIAFIVFNQALKKYEGLGA